MIAIIDYGIGNLRSVQKAFEFIGQETTITNNLVEINNCSHLILPGVGAYLDAMNCLISSGMRDAVVKAYQVGKPILGICLGMQMLFDSSQEGMENNGSKAVDGLGMLHGKIVKFDIDLKVPHVGWNSVEPMRDSVLYRGIEDKYFYFVHSYYLPRNNLFTNAITEYGVNFSCSIESENLFGVQFHPEKSGDTGLAMLSNFAKIRS